jgi:PHP family Zn ribbon phosphoesterase
VEKLADKDEGRRPKRGLDYKNIVPLKEVLGQLLRVGAGSKRVDKLYHELLFRFGSELNILRKVAVERLEKAGQPLLALALRRMRSGEVEVHPGYDGEYGTISLIREEDLRLSKQFSLVPGGPL